MDRVEPKNFSFLEFFFRYLLPGRPCIFAANLTENWRSRREWVESNGKPNLKFLTENFGAAKISAMKCIEDSYDQPKCIEMTFSDYVEKFVVDDSNAEKFYLKDWHFQKQFSDYKAYEVPVYFQSDWLNEYWDHKGNLVESDYRFVYFGAKGTWTPFHADVFRSHSWSANVCGRKRWILIPPDSKFDPKSTNFAEISSENFRSKGILVEIQEPGEVIFVPSNWIHRVENLDDCISINHNWVNASNIRQMSKFLTDSMAKIRREIADCSAQMTADEFDSQCQLILKADSGIDLPEFRQFLDFVREIRRKKFDTKMENFLTCEKCRRFLGDCEAENCFESAILRLKENCRCEIFPVNLCDFCSNFLANFDFLMLRSFDNDQARY